MYRLSHRTIFLFLIMFFADASRAQDLSGRYTVPTSRGAITLSLQRAASGQYTGTLVGDDGITFQVEGRVDEGELIGYLLMQGSRRAMIEAFAEGQQLYVTLIPLDAGGQPAYAAAQETVYQKEAGGGPLPGAGGPLAAGGNAPPANEGFAGTFSGNVNGTPARLELRQEGTRLSGQADAGGYGYTLSGTMAGSRAQGTLTDSQTGGQVNFEATLQGDVLTLRLLDPTTGQRGTLTFQRGTRTAGAEASVPEGAAGPHERDPALVGTWRKSETMVSGDASLVSEVFMEIRADGTFSQGNARVMAGGANPWGSWGADSGSSGDTVTGQWRTQGRIIQIFAPQIGQWVSIARYYVEGNKLLLYLSDGSRELWYRQ
ncbi:MAG: hypothetical protein KatS3mg043_1210 [Rhodothermaceae bacterium]|nr:MAG: hypothetical protein KatS3mg043_1210 [Rhodothermaceae bacterium]